MNKDTAPTLSEPAIAMRRIDRAVHELRGGYPVLLSGDKGRAWLAVSAEMFDEARYAELAAIAGQNAALVITGIRAYRLGLAKEAARAAYALPFAPLANDPERLACLIDPVQGTADTRGLLAKEARMQEAAALALARLASLLPAMIVVLLDVPNRVLWAAEHHILTVKVEDIARYKDGLAATLTQVGEAHVPLKLAENARVLVFRPRYGAVEHLAICIGQPETIVAPLVRVHSSCVTGDILGSLRCDCGEQLHEALARIAQEGHGVLLYMSQEGRGIGIVNKLRAYRLQDGGMDTVDANEEMGFAADERQFDSAAQMLRQLGIKTLRLLSNNPDKVAQLSQCGITVAERVSLSLPANVHNRNYLDTKAKRCGHVF